MKLDVLNYIITLLGAIVMVVFVILGLTKWNADLLMILPATVAGGFIFASGYFGINMNRKKVNSDLE
ncbi:hypothetical protein [Haloplasma contractile]|uniref:Uncharacterized protein n=1 Tax=Haloplasma contractile SSD-17B TaxID=1033810 RepID=U2FHK8_9MOLU|nr:hypothetical protein [Haloplasma contractile]ERJ12320.1 hypothetical protein HLPCO_001306 [Haloplasma contractile SSD-17B]